MCVFLLLWQRAIPVRIAGAETLLDLMRQNHRLEQREEMVQCLVEGMPV